MSADGVLGELELRPDRFANGGEAVARHDGRVIFIRGAIPAETVRVRITDTRRDAFWRAEVTEVLDPSPYRRTPGCAAAAAGAGCCDLTHIDPAHARDLKSRALVDVLGRIGGITDVDAPVRALNTPEGGRGWRIRARYGVDGQGRAGMTTAGGVDVLGGIACAAPAAQIWEAVGGTRYRPGADVAAVLDADGNPHVTEIAPADLATAGAFTAGGGGRRRAQRVRRGREGPRRGDVVVGAEVAPQQVGSRTWQIPVTGFWQAHRDAPAAYSAAVTELVERFAPAAPAVCWDLYGGAGVFAAALRDGPAADAQIHIAESSAAALDAARPVFAGDAGVQTHRGEVAALIGDLPSPEVVVLDPPRTGAGSAVIDRISAAQPTTVVHIGCDAGRFARDLALFVGHGFQVQEIRAYDAFPATHHVEAIAVLTRVGR